MGKTRLRIRLAPHRRLIRLHQSCADSGLHAAVPGADGAGAAPTTIFHTHELLTALATLDVGPCRIDLGKMASLYFAGSGMFLKAASLLDDDCAEAMLVGHNPAITDFANLLANAGIENIPTCGLVKMTLDIDDWSDIEPGSATLVEFDYPKKQTSE